MEEELKVLILEDVELDAELTEYEMRREGLNFKSRRVETENDFIKELENLKPDIILADYSLPTYDGLSALKIARDKSPKTPFIFVSGKIGNEYAIEMLKMGAKDYVFKHNLNKLVPAIERALIEKNEIEELIESRQELQTANEELIQMQGELKNTINKLTISNAELEQFAYVASHDMQEPLRMVASFTQLLDSRYKGQLDKDADEYIEFIVEGAHRMKDLIDGLLAFSRLKTQVSEFKEVSLELLMADVTLNLKKSIEENKVQITYEPLPTITADFSQIMQLFQNLISNAIKFHANEPPEIHISAHDSGKEWLFSISDNGIGIDTNHQERIFEVFKRLHTREEYPGTGIGLSICKRIVNIHNGKIWVESETGKGSTFYFTIPK
jgi:signal transduction histidine kinase